MHEDEFGSHRWSVHRNGGYVLIEEWIHEDLMFSLHYTLLLSATNDILLDQILTQVSDSANVCSSQVMAVLKLEDGIPWLHFYFLGVNLHYISVSFFLFFFYIPAISVMKKLNS